MKLKELLTKTNKFSKNEEKYLPSSFDLIGEVALIHISKKIKNKEKIIANALLKNNKNIQTVYSKGKHFGKLRKQKIKFLAGKKSEEVTYKESGCLFKFNIKTCFFSPRLSTDRLEIAKQVKTREKVLVLFAGIAPYAIVLAKIAKPKKVTCIELGKEACKYAKENARLNKVNIEIIQGDVKKICKKVKEKYDRIVMPRPQLDYDFLKEAFLISKKGTIIHFYDFVQEKDIEKVKDKIRKAAKKAKKKVKILKVKKIREIAPYKSHIRIDFQII